MNYVKYDSRPDSGLSADAWDYFTATYGRVKMMTLCSPCGVKSYWLANINGRIETATPEEVRGFTKTGKK